MNIKNRPPERRISRLLRAISQPARLRILWAIGPGEACVCHLEALLGMRQAYISQHLMALRKARLLTTRRDGRYVFYQLKTPQLLGLIQMAGALAGIPEAELEALRPPDPLPNCCCPNCGVETLPNMNTLEKAIP